MGVVNDGIDARGCAPSPLGDPSRWRPRERESTSVPSFFVCCGSFARSRPGKSPGRRRARRAPRSVRQFPGPADFRGTRPAARPCVAAGCGGSRILAGSVVRKPPYSVLTTRGNARFDGSAATTRAGGRPRWAPSARVRQWGGMTGEVDSRSFVCAPELPRESVSGDVDGRFAAPVIVPPPSARPRPWGLSVRRPSDDRIGGGWLRTIPLGGTHVRIHAAERLLGDVRRPRRSQQTDS